MKVEIRWLIFLLLHGTTCLSQAQVFKISCDTAKYINGTAPIIYRYSNLFDEYLQTKIEMKKTPIYFESSIGISKPYFLQLANTILLAIPGQSVKGILTENGDNFIIKDNDNINRLLVAFQINALNITSRYTAGSAFKEFLTLYDSLKQYAKKTIDSVSLTSIKQKYNINDEALSAIRQLCMAKLAHFSILPIIYKGNYDARLLRIIVNDIKIDNPVYWFEIQPGKIFLKNYFLKVSLPENNYNLEKAISSNEIFRNKEIQKFIVFQYYISALSSDSMLYKITELNKGFSVYEEQYHFTREESNILNQLKLRLNLTGKNILPLFTKQMLINGNGRKLSEVEKNILCSSQGGKVIIYYWASWCLPCLQTLSNLNSDEITFNNEKYKLLFISEDENQGDWLLKNYRILNSGNSFRVTDVKNIFFETFQINAIPRLFVIDNGVLIDQNFDKSRFVQMFKIKVMAIK